MKRLLPSNWRTRKDQDNIGPPDPIDLLVNAEFVVEHWYRKRYAVSDKSSVVAHYLRVGASRGYNPNPLFFGTWYLKRHLSALDGNTNPALHYLLIGSKRGFRPNPFFDPAWYREKYSDVASSRLDAVIHYLNYGAREGRNPSQDIQTQWLPQAIDPNTGQLMNPLVRYVELLELVSSDESRLLNNSSEAGT